MVAGLVSIPPSSFLGDMVMGKSVDSPSVLVVAGKGGESRTTTHKYFIETSSVFSLEGFSGKVQIEFCNR